MSKTIQKHLRGGGLCVFIRAYNDLDHITPIIYKYKKVYPKIPIDMIYIDHKLDLSNDFRIQFLQKHNIHLICLSDVKLINKHVQLLYHKLNFTSKGFKFNPLRIIKMIFKRIIDSRVSRIIDDLDVNNFIKNNFKEYPKLFLLDQNRIKFYSNIAAFGRQNDIPTVAVPHGHTLLLNELHGNKYMQYKENVHPFNLADKAPFTQTVFENELIRNRYIKYGTFNQKNSVAIGSTRFSDEWMEIIKKIIDPQIINYGNSKKLKIVIMLSKITYNGFEEERIRTVDFILQFPDIFLIVKPHTRFKTYNHEQNENLFVDNKHEYHSTNLIEWADLVIFEHSCISFHALKLDKPILYLSSTHANRLMSEPYFTSWEAKTRDEIRHTIWRMFENKYYRTYKKEDAEAYIKDIIEPMGKDVLGNYTELINSLID